MILTYRLTVRELMSQHLETAFKQDGVTPVLQGGYSEGNVIISCKVVEPSDFYITCHNLIRSGTIKSYEVISGE